MGEGASRWWQVNVGNSRNYVPEGRRLLKWLYLSQLVLIIVLFTVVFG
jgi:hypothetical protein